VQHVRLRYGGVVQGNDRFTGLACAIRRDLSCIAEPCWDFCMSATRVVCAIAIGLASLQGACFGAIVLNINPATEELWFSGSDTGGLEDSGFSWDVSWVLGSDGFGPSIVSDFNSPAFAPEPSNLDLTFLESGPDAPTGLILFLSYVADQSAISAVPTEAFSYGALDPAYRTYLNSLTSGSLAPTNPGLGWSNIAIVQVPEPPALAGLGVVASIAVVVAARRSRAARLRDKVLQSSQRNA
jgi:hypothetical protein